MVKWVRAPQIEYIKYISTSVDILDQFCILHVNNLLIFRRQLCSVLILLSRKQGYVYKFVWIATVIRSVLQRIHEKGNMNIGLKVYYSVATVYNYIQAIAVLYSCTWTGIYLLFPDQPSKLPVKI